ncbi:MAG TPA: glycosyltransferase [Candidatus Omnitrophota bacterium]|nr:glycosyltransferase [Candidatus Omnitrophota bacterium]
MKILILHASAGEGHRRAAIAVESALIRSGVSQADVQVADALDFGSPFFKKSYVDFYYWFIKYLPVMWGVFYALLDHPIVYRVFYPVRRVYNAWHGRKLLKHVFESKPDWIICTHFFSAELLGHAKASGKNIGHLLVLVTDFHPVRVWMHSGIDSYWVLSEDAKQTLIQRGVDGGQVIAGGFPILPEFQKTGDRNSILKKYQFDSGRLTILLTTGSFGLGEQERILDGLASLQDKVQCFVVCGRNQSLFESLKSKKYVYPVQVFGFVDFMSELMDASDLMVAKPGGATTAEAMAKGVPMIATGAIPGQETENLKFLLKEKAVFSAETPEEIICVIASVVGDSNLLNEKRRVCERICNPRAAEDLAQARFKLVSAHD